MNKVEFIKVFMEKAETDKKSSEKYVNAFIESIKESLKDEDIIQFTGFGSFKKRFVASREGHNPKNPDETITIPESYRITFTPGKQLKEAVNSKKSSKKSAAKKVVKSKKK